MKVPPLPPSWRPATADIPTLPGVYRFRDDQGRVIYVGKAKNLRSRLASYFQDPQGMHPRTVLMVQDASSVQWTVVGNEAEALTLEYQWIKQFDPRYNVMYKDDKSYPYLLVSMAEEFPRVSISRGAHKPGNRYFGPYTKVWAIRESIDLLLPVFPIRSCSAGVFRRAERLGRPCLLGYIDRCSAPCVGRISKEDHRELAEQLCDFMDGASEPMLTKLEQEMNQAVEELNFEVAAQKRDGIEAITKVQERNTLALPTNVNTDIYALVVDELEAAVQAFFVRGGRIRGTRGWVVERLEGKEAPDLMGDLLEQVYAARSQTMPQLGSKTAPVSVDDIAHLPVEAIPPEIWVTHQPTELSRLERVFTDLRGRKVAIKQPKRGVKAELLATASQNADHSLRVHKTARVGDITQRAVALEELMAALKLERAPLRIESFDISHTSGQHQVGSMVVFEDGAPRKDAYRIFNIDQQEVADDTAALAQVLERRFRRASTTTEEELQSGQVDADSSKPQRFAYQPDLLVIDGGLPQVNAAARTLKEQGVDLPVLGLAKRLEEVWLPNRKHPIILPRSSPGLYLLQHLRDESHRFAIRAHRRKRGKSQVQSTFDSLPGIGPVKQKALLKTFGSLKRLKEASVDQIAEVPGFGPASAARLHKQLEDLATTDKSPRNKGKGEANQ